MPRGQVARALILSILLLSWVAAQQISGSITGTVKDSQQASILGAKVVLLSQQQGTTREVSTGTDGSFVLTQLQPGTYNLTVEAAGFKKFEQKDVKIFASDRLTLPEIVLSVGSLNETVTVEASAVQIQTASAERSGVLTNRQVLEVGLLSRSLFDLTRTLPGVITGNSTSGLGVGSINANGNRNNQNNYTLDGVTNMDTGSNGGSLASTNIDMIAEMKVITNSQPAEFGRASGAQIQVVTKGGGKDFHGTGYFFHRHEDLNANTWRNNIDGRARPFYRYNYAGFNIGGPAYIPGKLNRNKDKFFFFVGMEWQNQLIPQSLQNVTVPTALERQGDFSQTHDSAGFSPNVTILDPLNNRTQFPGNKIPTSRINQDGYKILNWYPQANALGKDPSYNYQTYASNQYPRREEVYRGDYNINDKWKTYARYIRNADETKMQYGQWNASYNMPLGPMSFGAPGWSFVANVTTVINPTLTNEFVYGSSRNDLHIYPVTDAWSEKSLGLSYKMPYPSADTLGLVQNWQWDVPNSPTINFTGTPFKNYNHTIDYTDNMSKVWGVHTLKWGIYLHNSAKDQTSTSSVNGYINFNRDANNPGDANWAFATALLGNYRYVQQSSTVLNGQYRDWNVEWFVQDNWRVNSKLTLDYGIRFYWLQPQYDAALQTSSWNKNLYDPASAGVLRVAGRDASGVRVSVNPLTGETGPAALIGSLVNTGKGFVNGVYANGMGLAGKGGYPRGLIDGSGIRPAPRVGFAYQVIPKTVIRGGGGVFYDRLQGNPIFDMLPNPPSIATPQFWYGNLASIPSASSGVFFPGNVNGFDKKGQIPTTYNWNLTIQRELPFAILFDVGYVGAASNHLLYRLNQNAIPLGAAWLPQNQDPEKTPLYDGTTTKANNFYRPYSGFANTNAYGFGGNSNYHSMQVSANRRFSKDLTFGIAYTWSKAMGTTNDDYTTNTPFNMHTADYDVLSTDRTHVFVLNWVYTMPKFVKANNAAGKIGGMFINDWQVSGIGTMQSGQPGSVSFSISGIGNLNERYTGSPDVAPRVVYTNKMAYPGTQYAWLDYSLLKLPTVKGSQGFDSSRLPIRYPGIHNYDVTIMKYIPLGTERVKAQIRAEMFNFFNHPQFNAIANSATFNQAGQLVNTPTALGGTGGRFGFGAVTGTQDPRRIQLAVKLYF
ncbi:MAG: carboxypeptidase regulatory-like domain-containing protein [Acidobacteria bacterium]|nr:carboxypeptidase regulatory-like domain-containing protein [Acidobacteriota bacterium]